MMIECREGANVVDWLLNHIKYVDRALGLFLKLKIL
jgi:hypothetical protein